MDANTCWYSLWPRVRLTMTMELCLSLSFASSCPSLVCLYPVRPSCFFDSHGDNRTAVNLRDDLVPVHLGRVPYEWLHTCILSESLLPVPCLLSWHVCWKEQTAVLCCYCPVSPLCSTPPCPWRLNQRPDYPPFLLAKLWSMSYLGPVRVDPIGRQKPSFRRCV